MASLISAGCGGDECGPGDAPAFGLVASSADVVLTYGDLVSGQNNDCTDWSAPDVVISLTLEGTQMGSTSNIVFCVPYSDKLSAGAPIGDEFRVIDFNAEADGCTYSLAREAQSTGMARASGLCDDGASSAGYALTLDASLVLQRKCGASTDMIPFTVRGTTAVGPWPS